MHKNQNTKNARILLWYGANLKKNFQLVKIFETFPQYTAFHEPTTLLKGGDNFLILFVQFRLMGKKVTSCLG